MREIRSSGSVEGVMSNHDPYSDPPGICVPLHSHGDAESFYVLSGKAQLLTQTERGLEWQTLRPGDFAHITCGTKHAWRNPFADPLEVIVTTTPKLGRFLREFGELVTGSPVQ